VLCVNIYWRASLSLGEYQRKRRFEKSNEPRGVVKVGSGEGGIYVIQRHQATHLHWDLRLEMEGTLKSWAVPKDPPVEKGIRRLAVQVEDHPLDYANFQGTIPEGEYGAGKVEIWDKGTYKLVDKKPNKIIFEVNGERLKGTYCLVQFKEAKNWLFFRTK
jgi:DNA ligase D-like protein (predicted 3'-phosphoesterase)